MSKVTIETLTARIEHLERNKPQRSLLEDFQLEAFKMLLARLKAEKPIDWTKQCRHVWGYSMMDMKKRCVKCGEVVDV